MHAAFVLRFRSQISKKEIQTTRQLQSNDLWRTCRKYNRALHSTSILTIPFCCDQIYWNKFLESQIFVPDAKSLEIFLDFVFNEIVAILSINWLNSEEIQWKHHRTIFSSFSFPRNEFPKMSFIMAKSLLTWQQCHSHGTWWKHVHVIQAVSVKICNVP